MDLVTMRTRLRARIGNPDTGDVPDADLTRIINSAYSDISDRFRFHKTRKLCTFPTVLGQREYGLPADCLVILHLRDSVTGRKVVKRDTPDDEARPPEADDIQGVPEGYIRYRNFVAFDPIPDDVYTMEMFYIASVTDLADDADTPILPAPWHEGILKLARHYFYDEKGDVPKAQYALGIYNSWLSTKPNEVDQEKRDLDKGVRIPTLTMGRRGFSQETFDTE